MEEKRPFHGSDAGYPGADDPAADRAAEETVTSDPAAGAKSSKRIRVGLWDCPYCGSTAINGLKKHCPACGHPQDEGTKFYLGEEKEYLEGDEAGRYGKGADWTCAYCGALNRYDAVECVNCCAPREESSGDYFENEKKQAEKAARREEAIRAAEPETPAAPAPKKKNRWLLLAVAAVLIGLLIFTFLPSKKSASITDKSWMRVIYTEDYKNVQRSDWSLPSDATLVSSSREIHHYNQVLTGYEEVPVQRERDVIDHYKTVTDTVNNGDGTFTETDRKVPVYRTEYYTEYVKEPVYASVPVYGTKYVYTHMEWVPGETLTVTGSTDAPRWPDLAATDTCRESRRADSYILTVSSDKKEYRTAVTESMFGAYSVGDTAEATVVAGRVTKLDGNAVG